MAQPRPKFDWMRPFRGIIRYITGTTRKGEPLPNKVFFHTTYPDKRISEGDWFRLLRASSAYRATHRERMEIRRKA